MEICYRCNQREEEGEGLCNVCFTLQTNEGVARRLEDERSRLQRAERASRYLGGRD